MEDNEMNRILIALVISIHCSSSVVAEEPSWQELGAASLKKLEKIGKDTSELASDTVKDIQSISTDAKERVQNKWSTFKEDRAKKKQAAEAENSI